MTLKTGLQSTANTVVPVKSYRILNQFHVNVRFRHAVYVAPDLLGIASDDMLIAVWTEYRRDRQTDGRTDGQTSFNSIVRRV